MVVIAVVVDDLGFMFDTSTYIWFRISLFWGSHSKWYKYLLIPLYFSTVFTGVIMFPYFFSTPKSNQWWLGLTVETILNRVDVGFFHRY